MQYRGFVALLAAIGIAALSPLPAVAQDAGGGRAAADVVGSARPPGGVGLPHDHAARAAEELSDQDVLTDEQAAEREARAIEQNVDRPPPPGSTGGYNRFWVDTPSFVDNTRTSLIVDPPDGRLPALQPGVSHQVGSLGEDLQAERPIRYRVGGGRGGRSRGPRPSPSAASSASPTGRRCCRGATTRTCRCSRPPTTS